MSLPANTTYTLSGTTYVQTPGPTELIAAIRAAHPGLLADDVTWTVGGTTYDNTPTLRDIELALISLGASLTDNSIASLVAAARALGL